MIQIPEAFARGTAAREGRRGRDWIAALPGLVDEFLQRWDCTPTGAILHGQVGIVVPVRCSDVPSAVLKISFPHPGNVHEPDAFAAWGGRGAVALYERDDTSFAMLLERAERGSLADVADVDEAVAIAGRLAHRLAVPAPVGLPRLRDQMGQWEEELRKDAAHLADSSLQREVEAALATFRELGSEQLDTLVHGDLHYGNVLRAEREPWLAVDPKGYVGDVAYDAITLLRNRHQELLAAADLKSALLRRLAIFADAAGADPDRARRWAQARAVTDSLRGRRLGDPAWVIQLNDRIAGLLS
ncbi:MULTISPECIES: aminoglycoside phosphotransferase family protein [unclassified Streptomyces]|uniref:aminoglycoside phosphotransferase family protein n=1 Tax=unclassified Streptomyces TaxID=2593676 RepID=UPI003369C990